MPGCCVSGCRNNAKVGFRLFRLPSEKSNAERRQMWLNCMGRPSISAHSKICEVHFSPSQFENTREDGRRLLKPFAYPDLLAPQPLIDCTSIVCVQMGPKMEKARNSLPETIKIIIEGDEMDETSLLKSPLEQDSSGTSEDNDWISEDVSNGDQSMKGLNNTINTLKRKLDESSRKCHQLEKKLKRYSPTKLETVFTKDQLQYLKRSTCRGSTWSQETIEKALRLYIACGAKGYEEICKQKLPYPSVRTVQYHLRNMVMHQTSSLNPKEMDQS